MAYVAYTAERYGLVTTLTVSLVAINTFSGVQMLENAGHDVKEYFYHRDETTWVSA